MTFWGALGLALAGILLVACAFIVGMRWLESATHKWWSSRHYAPVTSRPWFVRFHEFINQ